MNQERDKFLTEKVLGGKHYNSIGEKHFYWIPDSFGMMTNDPVIIPDFSTPEGFFKLWNAAKEKDWWLSDAFFASLDSMLLKKRKVDMNLFIHPDRFADAIYKFLKEITK